MKFKYKTKATCKKHTHIHNEGEHLMRKITEKQPDKKNRHGKSKFISISFQKFAQDFIPFFCCCFFFFTTI